MVRLTDIIKGDSEAEESPDKKKAGEESAEQKRENGGFSMKGVMGDLRNTAGTFSKKTAPKEKRGVHLKGLLNREPEPEEKKEEPSKPAIPRKEIENVHNTMVQYVKFLFEKAKRNEPLNLNEGKKIITFILNTPEALEILYAKAVSLKTTTDLLYTHFVNVAIYALKVGLELKFDQERLIQLGISALVHDIGMARVPEHIATKIDKLTDEEFSQLRQHPQLGADIVRQLGEDYSWLVEAVYQEHERENGKGYPEGLVGDQINDYARIIGAVDVYEALTSPRPQRKRYLPYEATKEIVQSQRGFYWPKAVKVILTSLSAFPVNSYVRLNTKAIAKVVESNKMAPLRPKVTIVFDAKGEAQNNDKVVDLQSNSLVYIIGSLSEEDLPTS